MSYFHYQPEDLEARESAEDLSLSQFRAVRRFNDGRVGRAIAGDSIGILHNHPKAGQHATYQLQGTCPAVTAAAFDVSAKLTSDANGAMVVAALGAAYQYVADQVSTGPGDIVAVRREVGRA